ncbi:MAG: LysM peptidoglycan-binding domain-containing protein, partial [Pseudomonadota bacterium]
TVKRGESLSSISIKYNVTIRAIKRINRLSGDTVKIGQRLRLSGNAAPPASHRVVAGDTLSELADTYGLSLRRLRELNSLSSNRIRVGQNLKLR